MNTPIPAEAATVSPVRLRVVHETVYHYGAPVSLARHLAHLCPRSDDEQAVRGWQLDVQPPPDEAVDAEAAVAPSWVARQSSIDSWGNQRTVFSHSRHHDVLQVTSRFEVERRLTARAPVPSPAWEAVAETLRYRVGGSPLEATEFSLPSWYAPCTAALADFARQAFIPDVPLRDGAMALMRQVHAHLSYQPGSTQVGTRAPDALAQREGVCQDFAHVMIAACRSLGLAARYVSGYLLTAPPPGQAPLIGADASHAWVQVWCPAQGWLALDPTNAVPAALDHVHVAWGRDYGDVAPLRGVLQSGGAGPAAPRVRVQVDRVE